MLVSTQIQFRDNSGQFIALLNAAGAAAARELVETAADDAADLAPVGPAREDYGRRGKLTENIEPVMTSAKVGVIVVRPLHGGAQEHGAGPHMIPNAFGRGAPVLHPGNPAQPFVRPAIIALKGKARAIIERFYP